MKQIHLSIDDVWKSLLYLKRERPASVFDLRLYAAFKSWHEKYNARITLYAFEPFDIEERYIDEFRACADWLKFGYHGSSVMPFTEETDYAKSFESFSKTLTRYGLGETDILRLHCWQATHEQKEYLSSKGVSCLLYPDDDSLPYGYNDTFYDCGILHRRTRVRFESLEEATVSSLGIGRDYVAAFTHEWCFDEVRQKFETAISLWHKNGYSFVM